MAESVDRSSSDSGDHSTTDSDTPPKKVGKYDFLMNFPVKPEVPPKKVLFLGDEKIGKTSFIKKYCEHVRNFHQCDGFKGQNLVFTQYLFYRTELNLLIRLMDVPSGTNEECRREQYPDEVDSIVLCFAVDNPASFANVSKIWIPEIQKCYSETTLYYLLGLKSDLRNLGENENLVSKERAIQIHDEHKFSGKYMECSVVEDSTDAISTMQSIISNLFVNNPS